MLPYCLVLSSNAGQFFLVKRERLCKVFKKDHVHIIRKMWKVGNFLLIPEFWNVCTSAGFGNKDLQQGVSMGERCGK